MRDTEEQIKELKKEFRSLMNGVISRALRERGLGYHIIFGVELPRLQELAEQYGKDETLARALWKEDVRESRLLAPMLQPVDTFSQEMACLWADDIHYGEEAEVYAKYLLQRLSSAKELGMTWIAQESVWRQMCGFLTLSHLFARKVMLCERESEEFLDQATAAIASPPLNVAHSALNALNKYAGLGGKEERIVEKILCQ